MRTYALGFCGFGLMLAACGSESSDGQVADAAAGGRAADATPGDRYVPGLSKRGEALQFSLVEALPAPPQRGQNAWRVAITDLSGAAQSGCALSVSVFMPEHGHSSPVPPVATETEVAGEYAVTGIDLFMPRLWEVTVNATCAGGEDSAVFAFWIER